MTTINPYYMSWDGLVLATFAQSIETIAGLRTGPPRRRGVRYTGSRHGSDDFDSYFDELRMPLTVSLLPFDEDGTFDSDFSAVGHLQANWDDVVAVTAKRGQVEVRQILPTQDPEESGVEPLEVQGFGRFDKTYMVEGNASRWFMTTDLVLPWPFWHELPKVELSAASSHSFNTGGTSPVANMSFSFSADGEIADDETGHTIGISGMTGTEVVVDVRRRKVFEDGDLAMGLLRLGDGTPDYWMEWPARTDVSLTADTAVGVEFWRSRF